MVAETTLYDMLAISPSATSEEITRSYRKIALKCHPDKTNHDPRLTEQFKNVTRAYEILKDVSSRNVYDKYGEAGLDGRTNSHSRPGSTARPTSFTHRSATDVFSQVFNDFNSMFNNPSVNAAPFGDFSFGNRMGFDMGMNINMNMGGFGGAPTTKGMTKTVHPAPSQPPDNRLFRGQDIYHTCKSTLDDLAYGKTVKLQLPRRAKCETCHGEGGFNKSSCSVCQGSGRVVTILANQFTKYQTVGSCTVCNGEGTIVSRVCTACTDGFKVVNKLIQLRVPPGTKDGNKIVLKGAADEGKNMIPGDVIITIKEARHPYLVRRSNDLYMEHEIDLKTALLGGFIIIHDYLSKGNDLRIFINVHGNQQINNNINEAIQQGEIIGTINPNIPRIVKGLGMPINNETIDGKFFQTDVSKTSSIDMFHRGDLFIKFNIKIPQIESFSPEHLLALANILPSGSSDTSNFGELTDVHLSNIPDYVEPQSYNSSPPKQGSISSSDELRSAGSSEEPEQKKRREGA
ncbi:hypothetical protein PSN45_003049 [Yamadazyma tenuis]|uniref:DnaJ-domain-containing protein n=1 Tax=Candida tenuis (strain ATCC 10573 / BCRC 21748 / CBS 615 / JCM 9827 / NBRC 10315 / NRRL Y-1498 / VKM Y-70) TaxID=590646 RepID=G3AXD3_CANTC|nr:DnaJ-domain-containing protein [Yamadazyma tenuis ATCC 10573]EGV66343.1 DnaJ-domain-containing protein [Yamadazyma tenuis ATCC 10573]WEJ95529.1 hypothetical protein PSN45_003049 [Yamadazyma tenuis]